ncbi:DUF4352 domain-containing protein [Natranaerobius thermophilus]|uniref:DUF4352 domain-containing protein n=1 Tax=Natranaerobius thermophilus (strain ATCC BAA-1301 / DSM 18059 / JW/NM-WN-LF) TaxID=457570 RepID=B2A7V2_NATTJ|nr:DUF4352 domain-containing protein [Natranaerobius thermophilus]ACB84400.1 conserved hypothetical protein [Natranaerobius thermophilus JW/NM-WN-LF]
MLIKRHVITILVVCLFLVLAIGSADEEEPEAVDNGEAEVKEEDEQDEAKDEGEKDIEEDEEPEQADEVFNIGDTVKMGELEFTVNSARWDTGDEFMGPDEGERWLVIDCTIENLSDESTSISSMMMFDLIDEEHYSNDLSMGADTEGQLDGELGGGRTMRGEIAYSVSEDHSEWEFIFEPELFGFGQAIYAISEDEVQ